MNWAVKPISEEAPSGENLEYDPAFAALELAATPGQERQAGNEILAPEPPDYRAILKKAEPVMDRSHDLRAGVFVALAEINMNGFTGFAQATTYIRACLEQFWDTCHPQLDDEDDDDPTMRVNAVKGLADTATILKSVRTAPLTQSNAFGRISLLDIDIAKGEATATDEKPATEASISAAFKDTDDETLRALLTGARTALEDVKAIEAVFDDKTPGQGPDLSALAKLLQRVVTRLADETGADEEPAEQAQDIAADGTQAPASAAASGGVPGAINNSRDVTAALDRILAYYASQEPSSPLPILLHRAKRLVGADFMTILRDIAPDGVDNAQVLAGKDDPEDE